MIKEAKKREEGPGGSPCRTEWVQWARPRKFFTFFVGECEKIDILGVCTVV